MKTLLFKPFEKYPEKSLLFTGIVFTLLGSLLAYWFNVRFDGVLDLHFFQNVRPEVPFYDNLINVFSLTVLLFPLAKYLNKKTRFIDILITAMIARTPLYLLSFINMDGTMTAIYEQFLSSSNMKNQSIDLQKAMEIAMENGFLLAVVSLGSILILIWYIALLYNGFKTASHAKGTKPVILFSVALILAEVLSKLLVYKLY